MSEKEQLLEDLQYMKQIINDSKKIVVDSGIDFIVWGVIIIVGLIGTYLDAVISGTQYSGELWIALIAGGWLYSIIKWYKGRKRQRLETFAGKIIGGTWLSVGIAMTILGFVGGIFSGAYHGVYISPILASVLGIAFYITALIHNNQLMKYISPLWWVGSILMFFFPGLHVVLIMAGMMLFLQVVPGLIFYKKYKAERA